MKDFISMTDRTGSFGRGMRKLGAGPALVLALAIAGQAEPGGPGGHGRGGGMDLNPHMMHELNLAPDQEKKLKDVRLSAERRKIQLSAEKAIVELDLKNVLSTYPVNKIEALKLAEKIADADKKMLLLKVETMTNLMAGLTAEQHAKLMKIQEELHEKRKAWKEEMRKEGKFDKGGKEGKGGH